MTYLLIITCLIVIGTCVWIVVKEPNPNEYYVSDILISRVFSLSSDVIRLSRELNDLKIQNLGSGGSIKSEDRPFNPFEYTTEYIPPNLDVRKNSQKLARKKKRK